MPKQKTGHDAADPGSAWPLWTCYLVAVALELGLTAALHLVQPFFPLADFPIPYVLLLMGIAYYLGEGPAVAAFLTGLACFHYHFVEPINSLALPKLLGDQVRLTAFVLGTLTAGVAAVLIRRSAHRTRGLIQELHRERALLDVFTQNVPVGLALHDRDTRYVIANSTLAAMTGRRLDELIGRTVWDVLLPERAKEAARTLNSVFETGQPIVLEDQLMRELGERYFRLEYHPIHSSDDHLIGVAAVVVDTTGQVTTRLRMQETYEREHHIAESLQGGLTGPVPARLGCFEFEAAYRAAMEEARVGGDFYDVFQISEGKTGIVVGDVSGKGLKAATQVAMAKYSLRGWAYDCDDPSCILEQLNKTLVRGMDPESFVTVFAGILDRTSRALTYANAGHAPAMHWRASEGTAMMLDPTGPIMGIADGSKYGMASVQLEPGDEILLGTDGLFEIKCHGRWLDADWLLGLYTEFMQAGMQTCLALVDRVQELCGGGLRDDIAVLRIVLAEIEHQVDGAGI